MDTERSMYVDLKAAINCQVVHLKEHIAVLEKVSVIYSTGFFIKVSRIDYVGILALQPKRRDLLHEFERPTSWRFLPSRRC